MEQQRQIYMWAEGLWKQGIKCYVVVGTSPSLYIPFKGRVHRFTTGEHLRTWLIAHEGLGGQCNEEC